MDNQLAVLNSSDLDFLQNAPISWIEEAFNERLWEKEEEIVLALRDHDRVAVRSCHSSGKSFSSARLVIWFLNSFPHSKVITTAPTWKQVAEILWREIRTAKSHAIVPLAGNYLTSEIDIAEDWFATGISTNDSSRMQGYHGEHILVIVDEAAGVDEMIFEAIEGLLSSQGAKLLLIGNPTNIGGSFYDSFNKSNYQKIHISAFDTPNFTRFGITIEDIRNNSWDLKIAGQDLPCPYLITPDWVYDRYLSWGEDSPMWESRVLGNFPTQGDDTLIPLQKIEDAMVRELPLVETDPEQIGIDVARFGTDSTVFIYRKGPRVLDIRKFNRMDTMDTANNAEAFSMIYPKAQINVDVVGVGAGTYDILSRRLSGKARVNEVNVGSSPKDNERFLNLRAEMFWTLRDRFYTGDIDLSQVKDKKLLEDLAGQLSKLKFKVTARGQIQIESKEEMKKRGLDSPDMADACVLAFGMPNQNNLAFVTLEPLKPLAQPLKIMPNAQSESVPELSDEEKRKEAERQADLDTIKLQNRMRQNRW